jgi:hypothetical protein
MNECIDLGPELENLKTRLESDQKFYGQAAKMCLNTLIYHFERFIDQHKKHEEAASQAAILNAKIDKIQGDENETF